MKKNTRRTGSQYEKLAGAYLERCGYRVVAYNYRCRMGEIDLVAWHGAYLVFIEVKYREDANCGTPMEAVGYQKQRKISRTAMDYCRKYHIIPDTPCRFDVVAIQGDKIEIIENAFEYIE